MDVHSSFLFVLLLTCWPGQLTYGNPMSLNSKKQTTQTDDQQRNKTDHENFVNGRLPREWLRGAEVEEADSIYDGEAILPPEAKIDLEDRAVNTCDCAPVTASSSNDWRIVGGNEVNPKYRLPYQALVYPTVDGVGSFLCGGTIVNKRYIITAAHCTEHQGATITNVKVAIGEHNKCDGITNEGGSWISAKRVINHPNYHKDRWHHIYSDIAVLELSEDITFTANIKPACLPTSATKDYSNLAATISGWGGTIGWTGNRPQQPQQCTLKEGVVKVLSPTSQKCRSFLGTTTSTIRLCAWAEGTDTCQGDSGGPLTVAENGKFTLIGVVSYGRGCAHSTPGVYTRVQGFLPWIKNLIADGECSSGGSITGAAESGSIQSDNYPNQYPVSQDKTYEMSAAAGKKIKMTFAAFSLENDWRCGWDYLTIVDGNGRELLGKSCGSVKPATVTSQTNKVKVVFHSDSSVTSTGFKIDWVAV